RASSWPTLAWCRASTRVVAPRIADRSRRQEMLGCVMWSGKRVWSYRHRPSIGPAIKKRQEAQSEEVKAIAWKAQHRLHKRFQKLAVAGKHHGRVITAISRELLGFASAIGCKTPNFWTKGATRRLSCGP